MFRQEAIKGKQMKWHGHALLMPGVPLWAIVSTSLTFFIVITIFIVSANYTRRVNVTGEISTFPRAANVYSSVQGVIVKQFVREGEAISVGTPIFQIDVSKSSRSGVVSENQRQEIEDQLLRIKKIIKHLNSSKKSTLDMLEKQKKHFSGAFDSSKKIIEQARAGLESMKDNMDNYRIYQAKGLINKDQLSKQIAVYYQHQNNLLGLSGQNEQNALQIIMLESQIQTQSAEFDNQIARMELQYYELKKELLANDADGVIIVRALTDGRVDSLSVTIGQMVNIGDSLLLVIPQNITHYSLVLWVPNDAIPYINIGDKVNIRYEAFPPEKFGQFAGKITFISRVPASLQEMLTYHGAPKTSILNSVPYYKVMVRPDKQSITYGGNNIGLENGMKAQSTLYLEKRKVYQWMFSPLYDMKRSIEGPSNE